MIGPEERAEMFLFRFSAILPWSAKSQHLSRSNFLIRIVFLFVTFYFAKKIRPTLFSCPFGIILDLSVTSETFTNWIKFRRKYKYTKIAIGAKMNFAKNESVWIRINLKIFLQFQKVYTPYHISFVSFNDEVGYPKTQSYPRWNNSKNQTQPKPKKQYEYTLPETWLLNSK